MWTIVIDDPGVCQSVCHVASLWHLIWKKKQKMEVLVGVEILADSRNESPDFFDGFDVAFTKLLYQVVMFVAVFPVFNGFQRVVSSKC